MKARKRVTSIIMTLAIVMAVLTGIAPQMALAEGPVSIDLSNVLPKDDLDGTGYKCEAISVNGKTEYVVTITGSGDYELTGTINQFTDASHPTQVMVSAPTANITLNNMNVTLINSSPLSVSKGSAVNLTLAAGTENTLSMGSSEVSVAGLYVPDGASLVIGGTGKLNARGGASGNGAGIGGGFNQFDSTSGFDKNAGSITINSGIINAVGGPGGAGIGGSMYGLGGTVIIKGGEVTATSPTSPNSGAGIGGGFCNIGDVLITGGTVTAKSGMDYAEAIGTGYGTTGKSTVKITGGSVKALSIMSFYSKAKNAGIEEVYLTTVIVKDAGGNTVNNTEVYCTVGTSTFTAKTDDEGKLYLWLPTGNTAINIIIGAVSNWAVGSVTTDGAAVLTSAAFYPVAAINGTPYETWANAAAAVHAGETITLLKDTETGGTMPAVACTIDGGTALHTLTLNSDQLLKADITLKNLSLAAGSGISGAKLSCTDNSNKPHKLTITGKVSCSNKVHIESGSELNIEGTLEIADYVSISKFGKLTVQSGANLTVFSAGDIENAEINGTVTCKYFSMKSSGTSGILSGNGTINFTLDGGEGPNLLFNNVIIDSNALIKLDAKGYTPKAGQYLVGNKRIGATGSAAPLENISRLVLSSGYSGFKLAVDNSYEPEYDYVLKVNTIPTRKAGVSATASASVSVNSAYTLNLANIFADADNDVMTYKVKINDASPVMANGSYSYTPTAAGTTTLVFTANDVTADSKDTYTVTLTATSTDSGSTGGGSSSGSITEPPKVTTTTSGTGSNAVTTAGTGVSGAVSGGKQTVPVPTDTMTSLTDAAKKAESAGGKAIASIDTSSGSGLTNVGVTIPSAQFNAFASGTGAALQIKSGLGSVTFSSKAVDTIGSAGSGDVNFSIGTVNKTTLSADEQKHVGSRPVYSFSVTVGNTKVPEFGGNVTVSVPYTLGADEAPNAIVVYYIDASGKLQPMQGKYDVKTGTVTFVTTHFSEYMIGYNKVSFNDVSSTAWYSDAVTFIAARSITTGTGNGGFSPDAKLTRGDFLVMLMKAYGIAADSDVSSNFSDAGNTYYTGYLAAAKRLGISVGIGDNLFAPSREITRQEMFTLLYKALKVIDGLPKGGSVNKLSAYTDSAQIASWATEAMTMMVETETINGSNGKLSPTDLTTRAEIAQVLYKLLSK